ncbi:tetratricopeptide repeat protein [Streptosporangiaceae bacterium NEAU-GS5]|nr:tetratricopeptide repeat protein [Streptosporangiaceae bacterium NEAU-GS5]
MAPTQDRSPTSSVRLQLLGPVAGWRDDQRISLGPPRQRATLCVLAYEAGQPISRQRLIDKVWGEAPPKTVDQSVYTYVANLRRTLEPDRGRHEASRLIVTESTGYALNLDPSNIDVARFKRHLVIAGQLAHDNDREEALHELEAALSLWTGTALLGIPGPFAARERAKLDEMRLNAVEQSVELQIQLGRHLDAVVTLTGFVQEHRLREQARELLMVALYRSGRQSDALAVYHDTRRILNQELGIDPSEGLQRLYERILRADPDLNAPITRHKVLSVSEPRQLPRDTISFVGRSAELVKLKSLLAPWNDGPPHPMIAIIGKAGIGKSATAIHISHILRDRFPDALLYANLHGATANLCPLAPAEILSRFLRTLGISADHIPQAEDEAAALLRDRLAGRRALIVLDNVASADQIRLLCSLPQGSATLVTSRESLSSIDDCAQVRLDALTRTEAITMLAKLMGGERLAADPIGTTSLVNLCDRLPLALRIVGARLADRPSWTVSDMIERLKEERHRLAELESGDLGVRASLNASYEALRLSERAVDNDAARAFVSMGLLNTPDVTSETISTTINCSDDIASRALERLVDVHLLELIDHNRYRPHDLVRLFTIERALADTPLAARQAAFRRLLSYYVATAQLATHLMDAHRVPPPIPNVDAIPRALTEDVAFDWLELERPNLLAVAQQAMQSEDETIARLGIGLAFAMSWYLLYAVHRSDLNDASNLTLSTARRIGDLSLEANALWQISTSLERQGFHAESIPYIEEELRLQQKLGNRFAQMRALGNLAISLHNRESNNEALKYAKKQVDLAREIGSDVGERHALYVMGCIHLALEDFDLAILSQEQALTMAARASDLYHMSGIKLELGKILLKTGKLSDAREHLQASLAHARTVQARYDQPECLVSLAKCCRLIGDYESALSQADEALALSKTLGYLQWARQAADEKTAILAEWHSATSIPFQIRNYRGDSV